MKRSLYIFCLILFITGSVCLGSADPNSADTETDRMIDQYLSELLRVAMGDDENAQKDDGKNTENQKQPASVARETAAADPNTPAVNPTAQNDKKQKQPESQNTPETQNEAQQAKTAPADPNQPQLPTKSESLVKQVRRETYLPLDDTVRPTQNSGDEMQKLLTQLRSLRFTGTTTSNSDTRTTAEPEPQPDDQQTDTESKANTQTENETDTANTEPAEPLSLEKLIPDDPTRVVDHFALAETLFAAGQPEMAAKYYQLSLDKFGKNYSKTDSERAWILFQLGNCYYNTDPAKAQIIYEKLMREQPNSEWAPCANVKRQVLRWMLTEKPLELIDDQAAK